MILATTKRAARVAIPALIFLSFLGSGKTAEADGTIRRVWLPIQSANDGGSACGSQQWTGVCIVPDPAGGAFVFGPDLMHVAKDGTVALLDARAFADASIGSDGTIWAIQDGPCLCPDMYLVHLDVTGQQLAAYPWDQIAPWIVWPNRLDARVFATQGGAWVRDRETIVHVADDGSSTANLFPVALPGDDISSSFGLASKDGGSALVYWGVRHQGEDRYRWRFAHLDSTGVMAGEVALPRAQYYYNDIAQAPDGRPVLIGSGPSIVRMNPDGTFARKVLPSNRRVYRGGALGPVVLDNGDVYISVERLRRVHKAFILVGHEVWGLVSGNLEKVYSDVPGAGAGAVIAHPAALGNELAVVSGQQGTESDGVRSTVAIIRGGKVIADKTSRRAPGVPGFDFEGTVWWFPDGAVFKGATVVPVYLYLPQP